MATAKGFLNSAIEIMRKSSDIGKIMMEKSIMERARKSKFQRLGELTYSLHKAGRIQDESLDDLIMDIDEINKKLRKASNKLIVHASRSDNGK
ncbi:MAG: hypothetical protein JXA66_09380 [Oligoflexia bacterium]|nr:hypothetical protein [Oligoflexia bacterium]